jgi:hypothetical protein
VGPGLFGMGRPAVPRKATMLARRTTAAATSRGHPVLDGTRTMNDEVLLEAGGGAVPARILEALPSPATRLQTGKESRCVPRTCTMQGHTRMVCTWATQGRQSQESLGGNQRGGKQRVGRGIRTGIGTWAIGSTCPGSKSPLPGSREQKNPESPWLGNHGAEKRGVHGNS